MTSPRPHDPGKPHRGECLTCATDASPGGIVWTRTTVLIDTLRRFADQAQDACCVNHVAQGLREHADELAVLVAATRITTAAADGTEATP